MCLCVETLGFDLWFPLLFSSSIQVRRRRSGAFREAVIGKEDGVSTVMSKTRYGKMTVTVLSTVRWMSHATTGTDCSAFRPCTRTERV